MKKVSVNEFKGHVVEGVKHICRDLGWDFNKETHRGNAFQLWVARLMSDIDGGYDNPPDDAVLRAGNDLTADVVLIDSTRRHVVIVQCKFLSLAKKDVPLDEHEVTTFFGRHDQFANRDWVRQHGSGPAFELLGDYGELLESGYGVTFRYVATGKTTPRIDSVLAEQNASYAKRGLPLVCELYDFYGLKEYYVRGQSIEEGIPDVVELHLQKDRFIEKSDPRPTLIALIKGNQLRDLHKRHKDALFAFNIRGYLGNRGINDSIKKTARERPADFLYLNNGVSAICTDYTVERNLLRAKKLQIINGAQTVGTISREPPSDDLEVLFRLTQGEHVTTDKGFNRDIIQCNNTQNIIKVSDFRSNDPIQVWLERQIAALRASEPLPKCRYIRKRSSQRGIGIPIPLELFAKVRYSYLAEPTLV